LGGPRSVCHGSRREIVRSFGSGCTPIYDMLYVAIAERRATELVTADEALRRRLTHLAWIVAPDQAAL